MVNAQKAQFYIISAVLIAFLLFGISSTLRAKTQALDYEPLLLYKNIKAEILHTIEISRLNSKNPSEYDSNLNSNLESLKDFLGSRLSQKNYDFYLDYVIGEEIEIKIRLSNDKIKMEDSFKVKK